jgi:hypothetical protein
MGLPASKAAEGQTEVWSYNSGDGTTIASGSVSQGSFSGVSSRRFCQINVVMSAVAVSAVNYRGPPVGLITAGEPAQRSRRTAPGSVDGHHLSVVSSFENNSIRFALLHCSPIPKAAGARFNTCRFRPVLNYILSIVERRSNHAIGIPHGGGRSQAGERG